MKQEGAFVLLKSSNHKHSNETTGACSGCAVRWKTAETWDAGAPYHGASRLTRFGQAETDMQYVSQAGSKQTDIKCMNAFASSSSRWSQKHNADNHNNYGNAEGARRPGSH